MLIGAQRSLLKSPAVIASGEFNPADLFVGKEGVWWDFTDTSTLWQTVTGTTAVASNGDPIGQCDDKAAQSSLTTPLRAVADNGTRPTFVTGGGAQFTAASVSYLKALLAARYTGTTAYAWIVVKPNSSSQTDARILSLNDSDFPSDDYSTAEECSFLHQNSGQWKGYRAAAKSTTTAWTSDVRYIFESKYDGTNHTLYKDTTGETPVSSTGSFGSNLLHVGSLDAGAFGSSTFQGVIYEIGIVFGAIPDAGDITDLQAYLADKYP